MTVAAHIRPLPPHRRAHRVPACATPHENTTTRPQRMRAFFIATKCPRTGAWLISRCERIVCVLAGACLCTSEFLLTRHSEEEGVKSTRPPCQKCGTTECLTWHHVYPQRHFRHNAERMRVKISLCRTHHDDIERLIPREVLHDAALYWKIVNQFLQAA